MTVHDAQSAGARPESGLWAGIQDSIDSRAERLVRFRRRIHATPERSMEERQTSSLVAETLRETGFTPRLMEGGIGVVADLDLGADASTFVAVRAELDCVQVNDDKSVAYASTHPGLCHACGHDVHTTLALAAAVSLHEHAEALRQLGPKHNLRWVFQPGEETSAGARAMIKQGAIDGVEAIIAVHVEPFLEPGTVGLRKGPLTSGCKSFEIIVRGRTGHTARPHEALDPVPAAINLASLFYQLAPRSLDSRNPLALSVASIQAGSAFNALSSEVVVRGTLRTTRVEDTAVVQQKLEAIIAGVERATGCEITMTFPQHAPPTNNDPHLIDVMATSAEAVVGATNVTWIDQPSLGAEDFAFYQELIPGAIVRLGSGLTDGRTRQPLHSSLFDCNEAILPIGAAFLARTALTLALDVST